MRKIEVCEVGDDLLHLDFGGYGGEEELGLECHNSMSVETVGKGVDKYPGAWKIGTAGVIVCKAQRVQSDIGTIRFGTAEA